MLWLAVTLLASTPRSFTLPEALQQARASQPALEAARQRLEAARQDLRATERAWAPTLGLGAELVAGTANNSTAVVLGVWALDLPRIGGTKTLANPSWAPTASSLVGLTVRQQLFDFGRLSLQTAVNARLLDAERARLEAAQADLTGQVSEAFFTVQGAKAVQDAVAAALTRATLNRDFAQRAVDAGLKAPVELTRVAAELARAEVAQVRADEALHLARSALAAVMGLPDDEVDASGHLEDTAALPDRAPLQQQALDHEPTLQALRAQAAAQQAQADAAGAQHRPTLALSASLSARAGGTPPSSGEVPVGVGLLPVVPNYDVGAVLSWPLFDLVLDARRDAQQARADAARDDVLAVEQRLTHLVDQLWTRLNQARQAETALTAAVQAARANLDQAQARFEAGLGTSVELADAQNLHTDAQVQLALGRSSARVARAALERLTQEP
jgi:outer membrane protein TolC